jgi:beta-RFAP synthase
MFCIRTASRLHFGLLSLAPSGVVRPTRRFGSVGLMIESPGLVLSVEPASRWCAEGPLAERALAIALSFQRSLEETGQDAPPLAPCRLVVESAPREHVGLGTGTQLALAVARGLAATWGLNLTVVELARRVQRGTRSGVGIHGFAQGGFLVDGGKGPETVLAPLLARMEFPPSWRVVLVLPQSAAGLHGSREQAAFASLAGKEQTTEALCRLVLLGMLPALAEEDLPAFGEALFDFNARVGEMFAPIQGDVYAHAATPEVIRFIRQQGVAGTGQTSWGPGVFAVVSHQEQAAHLADRLCALLGTEAEVLVTRGCNRPASVEEG